MNEMTVVHRDNDAFAVRVRDHVIYVDQPYTAGGLDEGPTPVELFVASLAACAAHYARRYMKRHSIPAEGLEVSVDYAMSPSVPARVSRVGMCVRPPVRLSAAQTEGLLAAVAGCTVHNSIINPPRIGTEIETTVSVA